MARKDRLRRRGRPPPHALRTLAYASAESLQIAWLGEVEAQMRAGEALPARFSLESTTEAAARVLLLMHIDAPGRGSNRRRFTFQIWRGIGPAGDPRCVSKAIRLSDTSAQRKEPGIHHLVVRLNGERSGLRDLELLG